MPVEARPESILTARRNPELTRQRLMEAAVKLFAAKGRDGTSVGEICQAAGVNCRMIYHYFDSKDGLYMAVLEHVYGSIRNIALTADAHTQSLATYIETITERYFRFLQTNPEFVALLRWENASGAEGIRQLDLDNFRKAFTNATSRELDQQNGQSLKTEKILLIILTCCSLCGHYFSNQASMSSALRVDLSDPEFAEQWLTHIKKVAISNFCA